MSVRTQGRPDVIHLPRLAETADTSRVRDMLNAALDALVALAGLVLLFVGAVLMFAGHPNALAWLLVGALLLVADAGVTTRLRVARLERQLRDDEP